MLGAGLFWDSLSSHPVVLWGIVCCPVPNPGHLFSGYCRKARAVFKVWSNWAA